MRFKDLQEGKKYSFIKNKAIIYIIKDKLLWSVMDNSYSCLSAEEISELDFEEVPQYVTFKEAIEHMKKGNKASFYTIIYMLVDNILWFDFFDENAIFHTGMLEPKWRLL